MSDALAIQEEINERRAWVAAYKRRRCLACNSAEVYSTEGVGRVGTPGFTWLYGCLDCGERYFLMEKWLDDVPLRLVPAAQPEGAPDDR